MPRRRAISAALLLLALAVGLALVSRGGDRSAPASEGVTLAMPGRLALAHPARAAARGQIERAVRGMLRRRSLVRHGSRLRREVALTFDDGPSPYTAAIVRALRRAHAGATFFPVGSLIAGRPKAFAVMRDAGFLVGDHTLHHSLLTALPARAKLREVLGDVRQLRAHGIPGPGLFRPPYGSYDRTTLRIARRLRMLTVLWDVDSQDYNRPGPRAIVRNVVRRVRRGSIVLMHDGGGPRRQTVVALPRIIRTLRRRGYRLVTVPELF